MAITYIQKPQEWTPINNDMIYYAQTNSAISNVYLEVYNVSGTTSLVARIKLVVNAQGFAYCDVKQFLQSFVRNNQIHFDNVLWKALTNQSYFVSYQVRMVETIGGTSYNDTTRYAFNGQMPFTSFVEYTQDYNTNTSPLGKFLTNSPRVLKTDFARTNFLSYIDGASPATAIRLRTYESGASAPTQVFEKPVTDLTALAGIIALNATNIGVELATWNNVSSTYNGLSAQTWNTIGTIIINPNVTSIDICLINASSVIVSETFRFNLEEYCTKYQRTNIYWQNSLGGFDSFTFNMVKKTKYEIERKSIQSNPYVFTNSGYSQHTNRVFNLANQNYFSNYTEGVILNTDLLTDAEHIWMWELVKAHIIYVEQVIDGVTYYVPATIKATNYEVKQTKVDGIQGLTIELEYSYDNIKITK